MTAAVRRGTRLRPWLVRLHRWVGLAVAPVLVVAALTGSAIAFREELDAWLNPELFAASAGGAPLAPSEIVAKVEAADPRVRVFRVPLPHEPGEAIVVGVQPRIDPATRRPYAIDHNQVFVDPVTGAVLGRRLFGAFRLDRAHLMPFLYQLHFSLMVPGRWGIWVLGGVAILWFLDAFVAILLTLPRTGPLLAQWTTAWRIKRPAGPYRRNLDLHRAGGLWLWGVLLIVAFSGAALNLTAEVARPLVSAFSTLTPSAREAGASRLRRPPAEPKLSFEDAFAAALRVIAERGWAMAPLDATYIRPYGVYFVSVAVPGPGHDDGIGHPHLFFDDQDGTLLRAEVPGEGSAGDVFLALQNPLHTGRIAGLAGRFVVCLAGIVTAMLAVTGVVIWAMKRRARRLRRVTAVVAAE
ncbi:PepSY-associated TM helix domain-containing protein [Rhodoplanes sp. TEM]|uniref:PepSY-associated TM helix domain-containing protein n=1 Tax=Rhodoplanes tepidamans TaxID=200616 RepID=A0ABT5JDK5_RHOTP|nr:MULTISPECIES: PepSY-associated TM helix domain-containing protein [Rhodoplanes]MDC7787770.1 PepSY-associated TM helix domain-containing protein [Rhodoplanes tepidamans]MDC7982667.1 PepSY-associated TM helix domain-containing protein [Rhodoplanes sp. TEM]MDQ0357686.1 putative iron-regulated membrane protein [Rhodoplanes tepidamans]